MKTKLGRRALIRGALGTVIGLPLLECMMRSDGGALADGSPLASRYLVMQCPTSLVTSGSARTEAMTPQRTGAGYDVTPVLAPLEARGVLSEVSVVSGLFIPPIDAPGGYNVDFHGQATYAIMTGLRSGFSGVTWRPQGLSSDQLVAAELGSATLLPYLYYQIDPVRGGYSICYEQTRGHSDEPPIVWQGIEPEVSPASAYRRLVTGIAPDDPGGEDEAEALERRLRVSSLSYASDRIRALQARLGANDRRTLDEHLTRIRELERRIAGTVTTPGGDSCRDPMLGGPDPADLASGVADQDARAELFADLIQVAFACDLTRVITLGSASVLTGAGMRHEMWNEVGGLHADVQHGVVQSELDEANRWFVDVYGRVLQRLAASREGAGTVLDHTAALFVMEGGKGLSDDPQRSGDGGSDPNHSVDNALMLVGGRAGGLAPGRHISVSGRDLHHGVVFNTAMRAVGAEAQLGEITGTLDELLG